MAVGVRTAADFATSGQPSDVSVSEGTIGPGKVRDLYRLGVNSVRKETIDYWRNSAFLAGQQWIFYSRTLNRFDMLRRDPSRVQATINRLWPATRTIMAKVHKRPLAFDVVPSAADDATAHAAHLAESVLEASRRTLRWEEVRRQADEAMWRGGTAGICIDWDPRAGTRLGEDDQGRAVGTGDVKLQALSIVEMCTEPGSLDIETARWWIRSLALPPEVVKERYRMKKTPAADALAAAGPLQQKLLQTTQSESGTVNQLTLVLTYYQRPSEDRPGGRVMTIVGSDVVADDPWPFPFKDRNNLVVQRETFVPSRWTGDTILSAAVPVQTALNASWSSIIEHMKLAGNARLAISEGSMADDDELSDTPGEIIHYQGQQAPEYVSPPQMPNWWINQPEMLAVQIDDMLGVHDVSRGENPPNINSGVGLTILAEADDTPLGAIAAECAEAWGRLATMVLQCYEAKVTETRKARVGAPGLPPETVRWTGKDLLGQTQASMPVDNILPRSDAAEYGRAVQLTQQGLITDLKTFLDVAGKAGPQDAEEALDPDTAKAKRENHQMAVGLVAVPAEFDNHGVHINEHNRFRKSARYDDLAEKQRLVIDAHVKGHEVLAAEEAGGQVARQSVHPALAAAAQAHEPPDAVGGPAQTQQGGLPLVPASAAAGPTPGPPNPAGGTPDADAAGMVGPPGVVTAPGGPVPGPAGSQSIGGM